MKAAPALLGFGRVLGVSVVLLGIFGLGRLTRQFPAAADSPGLLVPFLTPVVALTLEASALVAFSAALLGLLGAAHAQPLAQRARSTAPVVAALGVVLAMAALLPRGTERPGSLANALVERSLAGCDGQSGNVPVPLLGLTVRCGAVPRIEGPMPGVKSVDVAMRGLSFSDDLRRVTIAGLELDAKRALHVHLRASTARIAGLAPWTRSAELPPLARFGILAGLGAVLWLGALLAWRSVEPALQPASQLPGGVASRWGRRLLGALLLALPGIAAAALVIALDQRRAPPIHYTASAAAAVAVVLGLRWLAGHAPKLFNSFSNF